MNVIANFLLYFLKLYLVGGALALLIMVYRCRKAWPELDMPVALRKMMFVSFLVSWFYVIDVVCYVVGNFINKQNEKLKK